jgi:hypothetical protein
MAAIVGSIISLGSICLFYEQTLSNYSRVDWDTKHELDTYSFSAIQFFLQNMNNAIIVNIVSVAEYITTRPFIRMLAATLVGH